MHIKSLTQSEIDIMQLGFDLSRLARRVDADMRTDVQSHAQEVSDLCARMRTAIDRISIIVDHHQPAYSDTALDPDQQWYALKVAVQTYRIAKSSNAKTRSGAEDK